MRSVYIKMGEYIYIYASTRLFWKVVAVVVVVPGLKIPLYSTVLIFCFTWNCHNLSMRR